jgi:hypothetical protein
MLSKSFLEMERETCGDKDNYVFKMEDKKNHTMFGTYTKPKGFIQEDGEFGLQ